MTTNLTNTIRTTDGRCVGWAECGAPSGLPVLWFHGAPGSRLDASPDGPFAPGYTAAGIRLIAVERPGYGISDPSPGRDLGLVADDAAHVLNHLAVDSFAVLGYSAGAPAALATAARLPDRVTAVGVLAGIAPPRLADHRDLGERDLFDLAAHAPHELNAQLSQLAALMRTDTPAAAMSMLAGLLTDDDQAVLTDPQLSGVLLQTLAESARHGLAGYAEDLHTLLGDWSDELDRIRQDVYVMHGSHDRVVPPRHGRAIAAAIPSAHYSEVPGGHLSVLTCLPHLLAELVTA